LKKIAITPKVARRSVRNTIPILVRWVVTEWRSGGTGKELELLDLCASIEKHGAWFKPLVRESHSLHCGLKVLFLRKEQPGKIYQGGDIDGRI